MGTGHPFGKGVICSYGEYIFCLGTGHPFVQRIDNLFGTRSSVYLLNYCVGKYERLSDSFRESFVPGVNGTGSYSFGE